MTGEWRFAGRLRTAGSQSTILTFAQQRGQSHALVRLALQYFDLIRGDRRPLQQHDQAAVVAVGGIASRLTPPISRISSSGFSQLRLA